jgi:hypothetical protein
MGRVQWLDVEFLRRHVGSAFQQISVTFRCSPKPVTCLSWGKKGVNECLLIPAADLKNLFLVKGCQGGVSHAGNNEIRKRLATGLSGFLEQFFLVGRYPRFQSFDTLC